MKTDKTIVKKQGKIIGFVWQNKDGFWYAFGKPSQSNYISFECNSIQDGVKKVFTQSL